MSNGEFIIRNPERRWRSAELAESAGDGGTNRGFSGGRRRRSPQARQLRRSGFGGRLRQRRPCGRAPRRLNLRRWWRRGELARANNFIHLLPVERLEFEQRLGDQLQLVDVGDRRR